MSYQLSKPSASIKATVNSILKKANLSMSSPESDKAVAMFNFVREEIKFGFTGSFDYATPEQTLLSKRGHCNPQGALFASLCEGVGLRARQRFVTIENDVLRGVLDGFMPPKLLHSYVEVDVDGTTRHVDAYIASKSLFENARQLLNEEGKPYGYGIAADGTSEWDGKSDSFVQMTSSPLDDFGAFDKPLDLINSSKNFQAFPFIGRFFFGLITPIFNNRVDSISKQNKQ